MIDREAVIRYHSAGYIDSKKIAEAVREVLDDAKTAPLVQAEEEEVLPPRFDLEANYPNPFNAATTIGFTLADERPLSLRIYDTSGRPSVIEAVHAGGDPRGGLGWPG